MGVFANYPIALGGRTGHQRHRRLRPGADAGLRLAGAMGVIVWEGIVVLVLVLVGLREAIMNAVPLSLKRAIGVGIGLFILFIGFVDGGLIIRPEAHRRARCRRRSCSRTVGALADRLGLAITIVLYVRKVPAALVLSIVITSVIALIVGVTTIPPTCPPRRTSRPSGSST